MTEKEFAALRSADQAEIRRLKGEVGTWKSRAEINGRMAFQIQDRLDEAVAVLMFYAHWEDNRGAYERAYDRTTLHFNYPGEPKAQTILRKWGME